MMNSGPTKKAMPCKSCGGAKDSSLQRKALQSAGSSPKMSPQYGSKSFGGQSFNTTGGTSTMSKYIGRGR
jgi:hypothetical protein